MMALQKKKYILKFWNFNLTWSSKIYGLMIKIMVWVLGQFMRPMLSLTT